MPFQQLLHEAIREAANPAAVFDRVVAQCLELVPRADGASLELRIDADTLEYVAAAGTLAPFVGLRLGLRTSLSGLAVLTGETQRCDDASHDPRVDAAAVRTTGVVSMLCVPLGIDGTSSACLKISAAYPHAFRDADTRILMRLARFLAVTLRAASDIAEVTASVLSPVPGMTADLPTLTTARFVANIMSPGLVDQVEQVDFIDTAFASGSVPMHVQPIVDLHSREVVAVEALARFAGPPTRTPDWWFAHAHAVGRGVDLELLAVESALALFPDLPQRVRLSINVGPVAMVDPRFLAMVQDTDRERLTVELTEHDAVTDYARLFDVRMRLRELGIRVSIDDAGSGYSGLNHVRQLMPDFIKLDRDLVTGVDVDPVRQAMCTALVDFVRRTEGWSLAEGVETESEAAMLVEIGVDRAQGYLFGRPMPIAEFRAHFV